MKKKTTIKDVAKEAGVSVSSVSLVLNGKANSIPEETKNRIIKCAKEMNYIPDLAAQTMVTKKTHTIGVLIPDIANAFFAECVRKIQVELSKYDYDIILCNSEEQMEKDLRYISIMLNRRVDGLILSLSAESLQKENNQVIKELLNELEVPYVMLDRYISSDNPRVCIDNEISGYNVAKFLLSKGHTKVGIITGPICLNSSYNRLRGFTRCFKENNIEIDDNNIVSLKYDVESGYIGAGRLIKNDITAIFAFDDLQAYGVINYAKENGYRIPEDISLVGFDDLLFSSFLVTDLTTVKQPIPEIAEEICKMILKMINNQDVEKKIKLKTQLVERSSVKDMLN